MTVNGKTVRTLGAKALPTDQIRVDDRALPTVRDPLYIMVHKPVGVVTTTRDPEGRPTVLQLVPSGLSRLFPVGRLDVQSTGLVLLTNDGDLAATLTHPRYHVPRTYRVKVSGTPDERALTRLRRGIRLDDGPTGPVEVSVEQRRPTKTWLTMTVHEGRNHLIRRLCEAVGHSVEKLQRVGLGPLALGKLAIGGARPLTPREITALRRVARQAHGPASAPPRRQRVARRDRRA